jgi:general secretion pathway protein J
MAARRNGFTLLEMLVALAVIGLVLTSLTQGVHFGMLAARSEARLAVANAGLNETDTTLRHLVQAMVPAGNDRGRPSLLAGLDAMTFLTDLPGDPAEADGSHVNATLLVDGRHRLILRWRKLPDPDLGAPPSRPEDTPLLDGVARLELAFWRPDGGWVGGWRVADPPAMIRIRLRFADPARHWPDLVMAPRLDRP